MSTENLGQQDVPIQAISIPASIEPARSLVQVMEQPSPTTTSAGGKKKTRSKSRNAEVAENQHHDPTTTKSNTNNKMETFQEMKLRDRSKSPFRRLLRTLSRSPLRRRNTKKNEGIGVENEPEPQQYYASTNGTTQQEFQQQQQRGDGVSSLGTTDYLQNMEYMVDPLGSVRSHSRLGIKPSHDSAYNGGGRSSISSGTVSRSESWYEDETSCSSSLQQQRDARETDSVSESRDSRGSMQQHERPVPIKIGRKRSKLQERTPTPIRKGKSLPSVREDDLPTATEVSKLANRVPTPPRRPRYNQPKSRSMRKSSKSQQVVWTKYPSPKEEKSCRSVVKIQQPPSTSSLCSEASLSTRVLLLLLHPSSKFFELIQLVFTPETSTVGDLLDSIPAQATEAKLSEQNYTGLVRAVKHAQAWTERLQPASQAYSRSHTIAPAGIVPGDVLVAIPYGYSRRHVIRLGLQILESPRIKSLLVDKFRAEMNVPRNITTPEISPPSALRREQSQEKTEWGLEAQPQSTTPHATTENLLDKEKPSAEAKNDHSLFRLFRNRSPSRSLSPSGGEKEQKSEETAALTEQAAVQPTASRSLMAADSIDKEDSTSWDNTSASLSDPAVLECTAPKKLDIPLQEPAPHARTQSKEEELQETVAPEERTAVQPITLHSLMAANAIDKEDSTSWDDTSASLSDPAVLKCTAPETENFDPAPQEPVPVARTSSNKELHPVVSRSLTCSVPDEKDASSSTEDLSNSESDIVITETRQVAANNMEATAEDFLPDQAVALESKSDPGKSLIDHSSSSSSSNNHLIAASIECPPTAARSLATGCSPVRKRIQELEQRIAACPAVPVPHVGPHDFSHGEEVGDESDDLPEMVENAHEDDSEESLNCFDNANVQKTKISEDVEKPEVEHASVVAGNDSGSLFESVEMMEHREILREALVHAESLPAPPPPTLEMFVKGSSASHEEGREDEVTVVTKNTALRRAPLASGSFDEASVDMSYSAWSHSVDSSLVSRYSLISHSSKSMMTEEEARTTESRAKAKQRRRQRVKLARSMKKIGLSAFVLMLGLYWLDPHRRVSTRSSEEVAVDVNSPLGFFGILQFVVAMCVLLKVQLLWQRSTEMKSGPCPFIKAINVFIETITERQS